MAVDWNTAKFLISCREAGVSFARTITLGHQTLMLDANAARSLLSQFYRVTPELEATLAKGRGYADGLFEALGAKELICADVSDYEGASLIHDMNAPLPPAHAGKFDFVFDGGTLEHIFNFPCALRNCMELVRPGGHLVLHTPTNNWSGHGFYQFSPELFFRALSDENGYKVERMVAYEAYPNSLMYEVSDPKQVRSRVELARGNHRMLLLVLAKRVHAAEIFKHAPQQSDYVDTWAMGSKQTIRASQQTAAWRVMEAWKDGRLMGGLKRRLVSLIGSDSLTESYETRRLSLKRQPKMFRPLSGDKARLE
ncbi:MAG TPA: methyltransferase domain-containing protein [Pseudolabrys sp.]